MATKTITITEDAYGVLYRLRLPDESFSDAIERLGTAKGSLRDCLGLWKDIAKEDKIRMRQAIASGRQTTQKILAKLHGHTA